MAEFVETDELPVYYEYESLVPTSNALKPKFMGYLRALLDVICGVKAAARGMDIAFDLDEAVGAQLDIIGSLVGLKRRLSYVPATGDLELSDDEYRLMIRLKIARNTWDGTNQGAVNIYNNIFGNSLWIEYVDNQDMSISVIVNGAVTTREAEILNATGNIIVPAGVGYGLYVNSGGATITVYVSGAVSGVAVVDRSIEIR